MTLLDLVGYLAALLTTAANLPQTWKAWRSGSTKDLSLRMLIVLSFGLALWLGYGIGKGDMPLMLANGISLALVVATLVVKLRHG